jgi:hypothetical protein
MVPLDKLGVNSAHHERSECERRLESRAQTQDHHGRRDNVESSLEQ